MQGRCPISRTEKKLELNIYRAYKVLYIYAGNILKPFDLTVDIMNIYYLNT